MKSSTSISTRVSRIVVTAVAVGIGISVGGFLLSDFRQSMKAEISRYQAAAYAFAAASGEALHMRETRKIYEVIRGVRDLPEVVYVSVADTSGQTLAEIGAGAQLLAGETAWWQVPTAVHVIADVRQHGAVIGTVTMHAEAQGLLDRYLNAAFFTALLGSTLVLITSVIAKLQVRRVVQPLKALSDEFVDIGQRSDLTRRLDKARNDEVGVLVDAFNQMFSHIDTRDQLLQKHRETLEETVEQRTAELRVAKDEAEHANAAKSTFLATMSHEIRTPMNGMLVMAEMLAVAPLSPRHQRYAEIITRSGKNLVHIINDILDVSKIEAGKIELETIEFSIDALVEDVACLFAERASEKGLALGIFVDPSLPTMVLGDPVRLSQVVSNLVNNGLKFTETGGVNIWVRAIDVDRLTIVVEDSGIGISADQIDRIFTRFSQAEASTARKFGGTGLGLSISRQLTELMDGSLRVESAPNEGSRFIVELPMKATSEGPIVEVRKPVCVALLDDGSSRGTLVAALERRGITVMSTVEPECEAVIMRADKRVASFVECHDLPLVLLRPFAATSTIPGAVEPEVELPLPLSRQALDDLCKALGDGTLASLRSTANGSVEKLVADLSHLSVLIVDDVAVNREVLAEALRTFSVDPDFADNGARAVTLASERVYDLIFMDCSMPGMDGFEASRQIRCIDVPCGRSAPAIVALTGHVMDGDGETWKSAGMNRYLVKPFNMKQLSTLFSDLGFTTTIGEGTAAPIGTNQPVDPLLSPETLSMFEVIRQSTGTDIKQKVFALFRANIMTAYRTAINEIEHDRTEGKRLVHALKSNCTSSGATRAAILCQNMEDTLSKGLKPSAAIIHGLEQALHETLEAMAVEETSVMVRST